MYSTGRVYQQVDYSDIHNFRVRHFQALLLFLCESADMILKMTLTWLLLLSDSATINEKVIRDAYTNVGSIDVYFLGNLKSSFAIGYIGTKFNNKWLIFSGLLYTSINIFIIPLLVRYGTPGLFSFLRWTLGISQGIMLPMVIGHTARWFPPYERTTFAAFIFSGTNLGIVITKVYVGMLFAHFVPWTSFCYFAGAIGLMVSSLWGFYGAHEPDKCPFISEDEKNYIYRYSEVDQGIINKNVKWRLMLTNIPFYALAQVHIAYTFGFWTILTLIPQYLHYVYGLEINEVGIMASTPYITAFIFAVPMAFVIELMIRKRILTLGFSRKLVNSVGMMGSAWCIICYSYGTDKTLTLFMISLQTSLSVFVHIGFYINHTDIAPNLACLTMALATGMAQILPIFLPNITKSILVDVYSPSQWNIILYLTASVFVISDIIYSIFGSTAIQKFNYTDRRMTEVR